MVYSDEMEDKIDAVIAALDKKYPDLVNKRWHALKLLEQDKEICEKYPVDLPDVLDKSYESEIITKSTTSSTRSSARCSCTSSGRTV